MHAKGSGAYGTLTVTHDITRFTKAKAFSAVGKKTEFFARFSTAAGERGAADAERDIRGFAVKFYTEEGNWDLVGNNTPVFFLRDPLKFPDLNHAVKRDPRTNLRGARNNWDFWTSLPEALHQITITISEVSLPATSRGANNDKASVLKTQSSYSQASLFPGMSAFAGCTRCFRRAGGDSKGLSPDAQQHAAENNVMQRRHHIPVQQPE